MDKKERAVGNFSKKAKTAAAALCTLLLAGCSGPADIRQPENTSSVTTEQKDEPTERTAEITAGSTAETTAGTTLPSSPIVQQPETTAAADPPILPLSAGEEAERQLAAAVFDRSAEEEVFACDLYDTYAVVTGFADAYLASYNGRDTVLTIPAELRGLPVRVIAAEAFAAGCGVSLSGVTLPEGLWRIEARAFYGQKALTQIVLPESLLNIGADAFGGGERIPLLYMNDMPLTVDAQGYRNEKRYDALY